MSRMSNTKERFSNVKVYDKQQTKGLLKVCILSSKRNVLICRSILSIK